MTSEKPPTLTFNASPAPTLGVEWELALVDPTTLDLTPRAGELLQVMSTMDPNHRVVREFLSNTIEFVTAVCETVADVENDLRESLDLALRAADDIGVELLSVGTHPFAHWGDQELSDKTNYQQIIERTQWWGRQMLIWGIHVHVGVRSKDRVWPIINAMLTLYPHILAMSASSPAWEGMDTGYASNRTLLYQQLPTAGLPYPTKTWDEWEEFTRDQLRSGVIDKPDAMHLDIRPAGKWGTIEVRFADTTTNMRDLSAIVAFVHCAVVYFDRAYDRGEDLPSLQQWHIVENKWRAARYGLDAIVIVDRDTNEKDVRDDIREWVKRLRPIADDLSCRRELEDVLTIVKEGAAYERLRRIARAAGAAREPGVRLAGEAGALDGFATPDAWKAAVRASINELKENFSDER
ncbi:glutamate--cysteine ligase [Corynebacterium sp. 23_3061]|uniref:glutamate--cysteine ligase n=1 Tax=Corynebacterium kroppenstedtii TaxID=161879 RepID=UPI00195764FB|nr:glutamate--cysteine ligase [Corynebacterium kroppenstedtii]QRQ64143.1 glutamate--cysteine ligase [Corynebacterium kroppenstedtii]